MAHRAVIVVALCAGLAHCAEEQRRPLRQLRGQLPKASTKDGWSFLNPNPDVLVWDQEVITTELGDYQRYSGWLKTPLVHDENISPYEAEAFVCLRVSAIPATNQPAKNGPLLFHCGGPGSGKGCLLNAKFDINNEGNASSLSKDFDVWTIDQRGVPLYGGLDHDMPDNVTVPPCPFKYPSGEPIKPFPEIRCSEIAKSGLSVEEIVQLIVGADEPESSIEEATSYVDPILAAGGLSNTASGIQAFNESFVRWFYRVLNLEHNLCYNAPQFKLRSPSGREYNALQFGGTIDLVHDLDHFRQAVGAPRMSIYGLSYGTVVAGIYGTVFPKHTRRLILDGVVDPFPEVEDRGVLFAKGITATWNGMTKACDLTATEDNENERCPAAPLSETKALRVIQDSSHPKRAAFVMDLIQNEIFGEFFGYAVNRNLFAGTVFACVEKYSSGREVDGCPDSLFTAVVSEDNVGFNETLSRLPRRPDWFGVSMQAMVMGTDTAGRLNEEAVIRWWKESMATQPLGTPWALAWVVAISTWPTSARPVPPMGSGSVSPVIVGNLHDPNTAYTSAQLARRSFPQGRLVTWQGVGHCLPAPGPVGPKLFADYQQANASNRLMNYTNDLAKYACASRIQKYLETGDLPLDGHSCIVPRLLYVGKADLGPAAMLLEMLVNVSDSKS